MPGAVIPVGTTWEGLRHGQQQSSDVMFVEMRDVVELETSVRERLMECSAPTELRRYKGEGAAEQKGGGTGEQ